MVVAYLEEGIRLPFLFPIRIPCWLFRAQQQQIQLGREPPAVRGRTLKTHPGVRRGIRKEYLALSIGRLLLYFRESWLPLSRITTIGKRGGERQGNLNEGCFGKHQRIHWKSWIELIYKVLWGWTNIIIFLLSSLSWVRFPFWNLSPNFVSRSYLFKRNWGDRMAFAVSGSHAMVVYEIRQTS